MDDFVTLVPLRGGSKGIKRKNLIKINNKPLLYYVLKASIDAGIRTVVSTEDSEIKSVCKNLFKGIDVIDRPAELASDHSSTDDVVEHFLKIDSNVNNIVLLQATSPMTTSNDLKKAISIFNTNKNKSLVSVVKTHPFLWDKYGKATNYDPRNRPRRQDWDGYYQENGAIYIFSRSQFQKDRCRCTKECSLYEMNVKSMFEIDEIEDFKFLSALLKEKE